MKGPGLKDAVKESMCQASKPNKETLSILDGNVGASSFLLGTKLIHFTKPEMSLQAKIPERVLSLFVNSKINHSLSPFPEIQ